MRQRVRREPTTLIMSDRLSPEHGYRYYSGKDDRGYDRARAIQAAMELSRDRWNPRLGDPDYLTLRQRRRLFTEWLHRVAGTSLQVLDIGGRIQPYRPLVEGRARCYVALDPQLEGIVDVVAVGEHLPLADATFDLVICAQVLSYVSSPERVVGEIRRVLKPGGALLLSAPAFFPRHHDERWRFLPEGLRHLLADFSRIEIAPEGCSIAGMCRTINIGLRLLLLRKPWLRAPIERMLIPLINLCGLAGDSLSKGSERFTANYSALAIK